MNKPRSRSPRSGGRTGRSTYPRTARVNEVLREVIAEELERIDDDRLAEVSVTDVRVDADFGHATVWFDALGGAERDAEVVEAFDEYRVRLQGAVGRQVRLRRTPTLGFAPDEVLRSAERIDRILRDSPIPERPDAADPVGGGPAGQPTD
jgi:ribosome-binding factor A